MVYRHRKHLEKLLKSPVPSCLVANSATCSFHVVSLCVNTSQVHVQDKLKHILYSFIFT